MKVTWMNASDATLFDMHAEVVILTGDNVVLNADEGCPGGVGAIISVPDDMLGAVGLLTPGVSRFQHRSRRPAATNRYSLFQRLLHASHC